MMLMLNIKRERQEDKGTKYYYSDIFFYDFVPSYFKFFILLLPR